MISVRYRDEEPSLCAVICINMIAYLIITQLEKQAQLHSCDTAVRISPVCSVRRLSVILFN